MGKKYTIHLAVDKQPVMNHYYIRNSKLAVESREEMVGDQRQRYYIMFCHHLSIEQIPYYVSELQGLFCYLERNERSR